MSIAVHSAAAVVEKGDPMAGKLTVDDVDSFMRRFKLLIGGIIVLFFLPLVIYAFYLDQRLDKFEATLRPSPPQELEVGELARGDLFHVATNPVEGQIVYVPAYSHVYHGDGKPHLLTITLSVRNTSMESEIVVRSIRYFDTKGVEVRSYLEKPVRLPPLGTTELVVERDDASGGSGANFIVEWYADKPVTEPIIEAVMIDTGSQQGISFVRRGFVIGEAASDEESNDD
ncbi:DUF3124 domain-containing protein [Rubinisphaera margarita]|uniref:DUF3124 domain-containing protein n=1 Tax=Rubinisphaera margarita TaxID=2909586 RepID=UPI001EE85DE3|nr:DUF3124 domain-containing protein [Rubinisphaera margarita]MCG6156623.1 DUF3124 domain-containing protein [Rubinisphaera margarita]